MNKKLQKGLTVTASMAMAMGVGIPVTTVLAAPATTAAKTETPAVAPGVTYLTQVQTTGWEKTWAANGSQAGTVGLSKRLEAIQIKLQDGTYPAGAGISYSVHVQTTGWQTAVKDGATAGTVGLSKRLEAIKINLVNMPGYSVEYKVQVQTSGWTDWLKDGQEAGTTGLSKRLEAIEIRVVKNVAVDPAEAIAETAVAKYEAAPLTTLTEVTAAEALKPAVAVTDVVKDSVKKDAFVARIAAVDAEITAAKAKLGEIKVSSVSAITAKSLKVTFSAPVADTTKAIFAVSKDTFKANVTTVTWNAAKTEATLLLSSKLTAGIYTASVTGLTTDALTGSVTTTDEKVAGIQILSDTAPIVDDLNTTASVGYKIVNQYGEDLTKLEDVQVSISGAKDAQAVDGKLTFKAATVFKTGDKVVVTLINTASATAATQILTISAESKATAVSFGTIYNKDGKTLNEDTNLSTDKFYIPLNVTDQYGNVITDHTKVADSDLFFTNTNPLSIVSKLSELTTIKINNVDTLVLPIDAPATKTKAVAGDATLTVIAAASGKSTQTKVTVAEAIRTDVVKLGTATAFAGEYTFVPVTVLDKSGNEIKDLTILTDAVKGLKISSTVGDAKTPDTLVVVDGALFIKFAPLANKNDVHTVVAQTSTNNVTTATFTAKDVIAPKVITGLVSTLSTSVRNQAGSHVDIDASKIIVEDEYGQVITADKLLSKLGTGYEIVAEAADAANDPFTVSTNAITKDGGTITVTYKDGKDVTSSNVVFKLATISSAGVITKLDSSAFEKEFTVVKDSSFASYKVADVTPIYVTGDAKQYVIPEGYDQSAVVKAVTSSGQEVTLKSGEDYTVKSTVLNTADNDINGNDAAGIVFAKDATTATAQMTITINATGEEIVKDVTFSTVAPKVTAVNLVADTKAADYIAGKTVDAVSTSTFVGNKSFNIDELEKLSDIVVTDQYGVQVALDEGTEAATFNNVITPDATLTLTKVSGDDIFASNGNTDASVVSFDADAVFNVKVSVSGISATPVKVTATNAYTSDEAAAAAAAANLAAATTSVTTAETTKTNATRSAAQTLVTALPDGAAKTALQGKITAIVTAEDTLATNLKAATTSVVKAEASKLEADVTAAQKLVTALPDGATKTDLQGRLTIITAPVFTNVSITSSNVVKTTATIGDTITLTFTSKVPVTAVNTFRMCGGNPGVITDVANVYTTSHVVDAGDAKGLATFQINMKNGAGIFSQTVETTTDASAVTIY